MIKLYTSPSCSSCRKVKKYFQKYKIEYTEKNIFTTPLTRDDVFKMLYNSENGVEDIISTRSNIYKEMGEQIENMKLHELVDFIVGNPSVLKRSIIVTDYELQVGYNDYDIELFLPEEIRNCECEHCFKDEPCEYERAIRIVD
ncbi:MAG: Spx/MgsR family RNA polymerase-binding regulatory protein [Bacilli bacterium]|nr:Spx/MgsR family RNA polymerase-binding regulatory protein [Bacilli bacterium]